MILDILQVFATNFQKLIDSARISLREQITAYNQAPIIAINKMPTPSGESEEAFIGKFMANPEMKKEYPDHKQRAAVAYKQWGENAKNNLSVEYQPIESASVEIPVIMEGVLSYGPGELGSSTTLGKTGAKVYYTKEAISDPEFLESILRAPYSVETHEKNTEEANRQPDGWSNKAWYDPAKGGTYAHGYVNGASNVQYVRDNKLRPGFGTSAFIKFIELKPQKGVTSTGEPYDAIATKLSCGHVAILENIRDKKNVIVAVNAVSENALQNDGSEGKDSVINGNDNSISKSENAGSVKMAEESKIDEKALKNAMEEIKAKDAKNAEFEEMKNSLKAANEKISELEGKMAKNAEEPKEDEKTKAENTDADGDGKEDAENAKNAVASQALIAQAAEILGVEFKTAPTLGALAKDFGVVGKNKLELATAINAKITELKGSAKVEAKNSEGKSAYQALSEAL